MLYFQNSVLVVDRDDRTFVLVVEKILNPIQKFVLSLTSLVPDTLSDKIFWLKLVH